jgi:hypothetical protein
VQEIAVLELRPFDAEAFKSSLSITRGCTMINDNLVGNSVTTWRSADD